MAKKFSFEHLSDTEFEEYCFELIKELDFINVDWRKGTGKSTSPSDSGRDIEAEKIIVDFDGETRTEKWFFECKHHTAGVSPDKIQGALSWATAERPEKLAILCSNFLSNPCKDYLKRYVGENKPNFKIKKWELKELEELSIGKINLLNKYKLSDGLDFLNLMHPLHIKYSSKPHANTLEYFFSILDTYDDKKREEIIQWTYPFFIDPRYREPLTGKETMVELQIDETNYDVLKEKCYKLSEIVPSLFIVKSLVNLMLEWTFDFGDKTRLDTLLKNHQSFLEFIKEELDKKEVEEKTLKKLIKITEDKIIELPNQIEHYYSLYVDFCENVLAKLMEEDIMNKIKDIGVE
jgi:hypothetical protein